MRQLIAVVTEEFSSVDGELFAFEGESEDAGWYVLD